MQFTEQQISAVARVLSDRASEDCGVDKDDNWKTYSENYLNDAHVALGATAAAPQVVADEFESLVAQFIDIIGVTDTGDTLADARSAIDKLHKVMAAPVQAQEPVALLTLGGIDGDEYGYNDLELVSRKAVEKLQEQLVRGQNSVVLPLFIAPVQPVAVPDGWREFIVNIATPYSEPLNSISGYNDKSSRKEAMGALRAKAAELLETAPAAQVDAITWYKLFEVVRGTGYVTSNQAGEICDKVIAAIAAKAAS